MSVAMSRSLMIITTVILFNLFSIPTYSSETLTDSERTSYARTRFKEFQTAVALYGSKMKELTSLALAKNEVKDPAKRIILEEEQYSFILSLEPVVIELDQQLDDSRPSLKAETYEDLKQSLKVCRDAHKETYKASLRSLATAYDHFGKPRLGVSLRRLYCELAPKDWQAWEQLATTCYLSGDFQSATDSVKTSLSITPKAVPALENAADIKIAQKQYDDAVGLLEQALEHVSLPTKPVISASLASALSKAGRRQEASVQLKSAYDHYADLQSHRQDFFLATARAEFELGNYSKALSQLSKAFEEGLKITGYVPQLAEARLLQGICYAKLGNIESAKEQWLDASPLISSLPFLQEKEAQLSQLIGNKPAKSGVNQKWALLIGVSKFKDSGIPKLRYASKDAKDLQQFLVQRLSFSPDHIHVLTDEAATRQNILDELGDKWLPKVVQSDDLFFLFISSHGTPAHNDIGSLNYVVAHDTTKDHLFSTGVPMQEISRLLRNRVKPKRMIIVVDTCYSGATSITSTDSGNVDPRALLTSASELIIAASSPDERSWESKRYPNGVFTRQFIDVIGRRATTSKNVHVLFPDIARLTSSEVKSDNGATQTPIAVGQWSGEEFLSVAEK